MLNDVIHGGVAVSTIMGNKWRRGKGVVKKKPRIGLRTQGRGLQVKKWLASGEWDEAVGNWCTIPRNEEGDQNPRPENEHGAQVGK
jgi:hypothetical protein